MEKVSRAESEIGTNGDLTVALNTVLDDALISKGLAREVVNRVQRARKELNLNVADRIVIVFATDAPLGAAISAHHGYIAGETLAKVLQPGELASDAIETQIDGRRFGFSITVA